MKFIIGLLSILCVTKVIAQELEYDYLIFPDTSRKIEIIQAVESEDDLLSGVYLKNIALKEKIEEVLINDFHKSMIKLGQCSRNLAGNVDGPNVLYISNTQGGFARKGIRIIDSIGTSKVFPSLNYVDLVISEKEFRAQDLDLYSHELGHVMMNTIWNNFYDAANNLSPKMHVSMGITDYFTAFFEGFGEHFERISLEKVPQFELAFNQRYRNIEATPSYWYSSIGRRLRINGVHFNDYIYKKMIPEIAKVDSLTLEDKIMLYHTSPIFDKSNLKNAQEMLSCEGVLATLFYKINTSEEIQNSYLNSGFYTNFLISDIGDVDPSAIFSPFENAILKNFWVWNKMKIADYSETILFNEFLNTWISEFPNDKEVIIKILVSVTKGMTADTSLKAPFEKMVYYGMVGNYFKYLEVRKEYLKTESKLISFLISDEINLDDNVGPELWIENDDFQIKNTLWSSEPRSNLKININTANKYELMGFVNNDEEMADKIINERNELGYFVSLEQLSQPIIGLEKKRFPTLYNKH